MTYLFKFCVVLVLMLSSAMLQAAQPLNLGVFAYRPKPVMLARYQPLVDYLNQQLACCEVKLHILTLAEMEVAVAANQLDLIFTNPRHYILLRHQNKLTGAIATLVKHGASNIGTQYLGGVIFTRSSEQSINQLADVKGRRIGIPGKRFLGGYQTQAYEFLQVGVDLDEEATLVELGGHDKVVKAVLAGEIEVGFVRTEILESLSQQGLFDLVELKILNRQTLENFPFISSTRLYPEWPFVALPQVKTKTISRIASALLALGEKNTAIYQEGIAGFAPPADYLPVEQVARALRLPPYEKAPAFTLEDIWAKHQEGVSLLAFFIAVTTILSILLIRRNRSLFKQRALIKEQATRIQQIIQATQAGTWEWNIQTGETIFNDCWAEQLGYRLDELLPASSDTWRERIHLDDAKRVEAALLAHLTGKVEYYNIDLRMRHKSGRWVCINARGAVTRWSKNGEALWMSGTHTDISQRKEFERKLSRAHRLVEESLNEIYIFDKTTLKFIDVNLSARNNLGYTLAELTALTPIDIKPLISQQTLTKLIQPLLNGSQKELIFKTEHQRKDGSCYPVEVHLQLQDDEPPVFVAIIQDITQRLKKETQLHELVHRFNKIASRVPGLVCQFRMTVEGHFCIPYASEQIQALYRVSAEEVKENATQVLQLIHPDDYKQVVESIQESARLLQPWKLEYRVCFAGESDRWFYGNAIPEREADGCTLWHGFVTDITEQKHTELVLQQSQTKYQRLVEEIGDNFVIFSHTGLTGELTYVSDAVEKIADLSKEEVIGRPWGEVVDWLPSSIELGMEVLQRQLEGVTDFEQLELSFNHPDGNLRTLFVSTHPVHNEQGEVIAIEGIAEDISARKFAQEQMRLAASVFANSQEGIFICDKDSRIIDLNPACERLTGYAREEIIGRTPSMFKSDLQDAKFYTKLWDTLTKTGHWQGEVWNRNKSGDLYSERLSIDIVYDDKGALQNYVAVFYDTTYLKEHEKQLEFIAYHDALTRLPNRLLLQDRLQLALAKAKRSGKLLAVCYLDLDGFKPVNDTYGHKIGDKVLVEAAQRMQEAVRADDTVSRIGGDEFVLLMQDIAHIEELEQALQRILDIISSSYSFYEEGCILEVGSISASIGVTLYPDDNSDADILLRHADQAMYRAKYYGKNQYSFFDLGEEKKFTTERTLQQSVELAIEKQEFILLYQPKVNMRTGEVIGVEGLIRWQHPEKGLLTPDKFLSSLQHSQRIVDVGNWVLRRALLQMRDWLAVGIELSVSVNVDAMQLQQTDFVSALKALLVEFSDVPARLLELEITEASALHDIDSVSEIIKECVALGVQFSLDDFGTGYSSLTYLKRLPVQALKVDQSFIRGLAENSDDMVILEGILGLANAFRRTPIAEGVETVRVGVLLLSLGYQFGQGYAISRAMPATAIPQWLAEFDIPPQWRNIENTFESDLSYSLSLLSLSHHRIITRVCHAIEQANPLLIPDYFSDNQLCKLGQWLGTEGEEYYGEASGFAMLVSKHQKMHQLIEEVMQLFGAGEQVSQHYSVELGRLSKELLDDINALKGSVVICC